MGGSGETGWAVKQGEIVSERNRKDKVNERTSEFDEEVSYVENIGGYSTFCE